MNKLNDNIHHQAEIDGNKLSCFICLIVMLMFMSMYILTAFNVISVISNNNDFRTIVTNMMVILMTICYILGLIFNYDKSWLKYLLLFSLLIIFNMNYVFVNYGMHIIFIIPLILSCRYYNTKLILFVFIFTIVFSFFSICIGEIVSTLRELRALYINEVNGSLLNGRDLLEFYNIKSIDIIIKSIRKTFIPVAILELLVFIICNVITRCGNYMIKEQADFSTKTASVEKELSVAADIQLNMLPKEIIYSEESNFDIFASMIPAREVGGDLYDFFQIDENKIAILIGDVSGKGMPAAMFMVRAITLIKDQILIGNAPRDIFNVVNKSLCESNKEGLFVTAWLGIIDLESHSLIYVNAGHNPPLIKKSNTEFEYLKMNPGFVLAGLDDFVYEENAISFNEGDRIILYTDGVTEARDDKKEFFGEKRLKDFVNQNNSKNAKELVLKLNDEIKNFSNNAEQYDDITVLVFDYKKELKKEVDNNVYKVNKTFNANISSVKDVVSFIKESLLLYNCNKKIILKILVAVEELFGNVIFYAYDNKMGTVNIQLEKDNEKVAVILKDTGKHFDLLSYEDPDFDEISKLEVKTHDLGIFIVKKTMDKVTYERKDNMNIVTIIKYLKENDTSNNQLKEKKQKTYSCQTTLDAYKELSNFVKDELIKNDCPLNVVNQILVVVDELYSNVVLHGYPNGGHGMFEINILCDNNNAELILIDDAIEFNLLEYKDPDIKLPAEKREIGGLGIYIVKKTMDEFSYERINNHNVVTIKKYW